MQIYHWLTHQCKSHKQFILCRKICGVRKEEKIKFLTVGDHEDIKPELLEMSYAIAGVTLVAYTVHLTVSVGHITISLYWEKQK
jgi:hypothetical protein